MPRTREFLSHLGWHGEFEVPIDVGGDFGPPAAAGERARERPQEARS